MQHTLLPLEERILLRREYRMRVFVVLCFATAVALALGIGALFPAFVRVTIEERTQLSTIATLQKNKQESGSEGIEREFARDARLLSALSADAAQFAYSDSIQEIIRLRRTVKLSSVSVDRTATTTLVTRLQGIAPTREALVTYKAQLEEQLPGALVELPISELARSKDIAFSLAITQKLK